MSGQAIGLIGALIGGGTAIVANLITGWFTRSAGARQADATLESVQSTHEEQRAVRVLDLRRQTYARLIDAAETAIQARERGEDGGDDRSALQSAFSMVLLEGPEEVATAARALVDRLGTEGFSSIEDIVRARQDFIDSARAALSHP